LQQAEEIKETGLCEEDRVWSGAQPTAVDKAIAEQSLTSPGLCPCKGVPF